jgi:hypothetical protein
MKNGKAIRRAGYSALTALLALVFWGVWDVTQKQPGESSLPSGGAATVISAMCIILAVAAGGYAVFILVRAFYLGFTRPELKAKQNDDP